MATEDNPKKPSVMSSLLSTAKSAAHLAAKQAEKTKLTTIALPGQYQPLGKHCYESQQHRSEFADLFQKLDAVRSQLAAVATSSEGKPTPQTLGDKAKATAGKAMQAAQSQKLAMQQSSLFGALGKAVYEAHGENSGPSNLTAPIAKSLARLSELDADLARLSSEGKGSWLTPKRKERLIGIGVIVLVCLLLLPLVQKARKAAQDAKRNSGDFVPHTPGTSRDYLHAMYPPGDSIPIVTLNHVLHKDNGEIESTIAKTGRLKNAKQDLALDNIEWLVDGSNKSTSFHRVNDGFVEHGSPSAGSGTIEWEPIFKIGAKPDDTWEWNPSPGIKKTYTVTKATTWNGKPALIVREEMALPNNGAIIVFHTYAGGVGKVDSSASMIQPGRTPAMQKTYDQKIIESSISSQPKPANSIPPINQPQITTPKDVISNGNRISAVDLIDAFSNEVAGNKLYGGKSLEVTGKVVKVHQEWPSESAQTKQYCVVLGGHPGPRGYTTWVECFVDNPNAVESVVPGSNIVVRGRVQDRYSAAVRLTKCEIVND